ncbi:MAG: TonB-dependent receptor [Chitinophagales bacterium]|nr:TonB-dependent receptor [Chitinophagales bacterium]
MRFKQPHIFTIILFLLFASHAWGQGNSLSGKIQAEGKPIEFAQIGLIGTSFGSTTDSTGKYLLRNIPAGNYVVHVTALGYKKWEKAIALRTGEQVSMTIDLTNYQNTLQDIVISGTLKEVMRSESPVPVEVFTPIFFKKNPTASIYEALQNVNGVRPQLNCNVCNTGDIHINGLEGPYTMILIDGMPIVSSLSTVYGLSGIPNSLIERVEVVKGPASSLYGSEAVGGLINIITKKASSAPKLSLDVFTNSYGEVNADGGFKFTLPKKADVLTGINYFNFQNRVDLNADNFTDMTLQHRISLFQKWNFIRSEKRIANIALRYMYEDRWGGDMRWEKQFRGGDSIYGESIYTNRWEVLGNYQLPIKEKIVLSYSYNDHQQDSRYGDMAYIAAQRIGFGQLTWDKKWGIHDILLGTAIRYTFYDDNTPATASPDTLNPSNLPQKTWLPGVFLQDEIKINVQHTLLMGFRYDYNSVHGNIYTPRLGYKWSLNEKNIFRLNAGMGYRVVNVYAEDHAALTGARIVEIKSALKPERSYNINLNYIKKIFTENGSFIGFDAAIFYTYFNNRIVGNFEKDPNKIIYDNLAGYAESKGMSLNMDMSFVSGLKIIAGVTLMENSLTENGSTIQQILTEKFTGTWSISYKFRKQHLSVDYTGNLYSPMRLPILSGLDPRSATSPWWSIQNIQILYSGFKNIELYLGVKNLLNWTPNQGNPFIIARSQDPFDKNVAFDAQGKALVTADNPYGLTFDPNYVYGPNQGIRGFVGMRIKIQ